MYLLLGVKVMRTSPFSCLTDKEFEEAVIKTYAFTRRKMLHLRGTRLYSIMDYEDITNEAITKTLSGDRAWNQKKYPLFVHLAGCAKGIISNLSKKADIVQCDSSSEMDLEEHKDLTPEDIHLILTELDEFVEYVEKNRKDLVKLAKAILVKEISKPKELSKHLGISVRKVNSGKVALKRIYKKINGRCYNESV